MYDPGQGAEAELVHLTWFAEKKTETVWFVNVTFPI